jgi:hypothetical protein
MKEEKSYSKAWPSNELYERVPAYRYPNLPTCRNDSEGITTRKITLVNQKGGVNEVPKRERR